MLNYKIVAANSGQHKGRWKKYGALCFKTGKLLNKIFFWRIKHVFYAYIKTGFYVRLVIYPNKSSTFECQIIYDFLKQNFKLFIDL